MARRLIILKSLSVVKFLFRILTKTEETELRINFFQLSPEEFLAHCQHYSLSQCGFLTPFVNNFELTTKSTRFKILDSNRVGIPSFHESANASNYKGVKYLRHSVP